MPPWVFVTDLERPELTLEDRRHLERSLRVRAGQPIVVCDGLGSWRDARLGPIVEPTGVVKFRERRSPPIMIVFAPVKGDRPEWAVAKLTELGVDTIVPMSCHRSVVRWGPDHDLSRLRRVAREAAMQSRQVWLPSVGAPMSFAVASRLAGACVADADGDSPGLDRPVVLIGPEGGWDDSERSAALPQVRLGPSVLRAETAAVVAGALLTALRDDVVR